AAVIWWWGGAGRAVAGATHGRESSVLPRSTTSASKPTSAVLKKRSLRRPPLNSFADLASISMAPPSWILSLALLTTSVLLTTSLAGSAAVEAVPLAGLAVAARAPPRVGVSAFHSRTAFPGSPFSVV